MQSVQYIGKGEFGDIYEGPKGAEAESFMLESKSGEVRNAFYHKSIGGDIDLFWGNKNAGYAKIVSKHPEVIGKIQEILDRSRVYSVSPNRIKLTSGKYNSIIGLSWFGKSKKWVITSYEDMLSETKQTTSCDVACPDYGPWQIALFGCNFIISFE